MTYSLAVRPSLDEKLQKLFRKNRKQYEIIKKKSEEILLNPWHYKDLRAPMQHQKRVHVDTHVVLTFSIDEEKKIVMLEDFDHHDKIYKN